MKYLILISFFITINCSTQKKNDAQKYLNGEVILQRYYLLVAKYDSLVERNKDILTYKEGGYYRNSVNLNGKQFDLQKSRFFLREKDKDVFVNSSTGGNFVYVYQDQILIEKVHLAKKKNFVNSLDNFIDKVFVEYSQQNNKVYISNYILDTDGTPETVLYREYLNNNLLLETNYKRDFKIGKNELLSKLSENFYSSALLYVKNEGFKNKIGQGISNQSIQKDLLNLKESIAIATALKNEFYQTISISRKYDSFNQPFYDVLINNWQLKINARNNKVFSINFEINEY